MSQGASIVCFAFSTLGQSDEPSLILGYNSVDKITGIIFISRQEILRNIEPTSSTFSVPILPRPWKYPRYPLELFALPQNLCPLCWLYFLSLASCHIKPGCARSLHFHQWWHLLGGLTFIVNALSPPLKFCSPFFHRAIRRRLIPKCFHEVFINFLGRHSLFITALTSTFSILQV